MCLVVHIRELLIPKRIELDFLASRSRQEWLVKMMLAHIPNSQMNEQTRLLKENLGKKNYKILALFQVCEWHITQLGMLM